MCWCLEYRTIKLRAVPNIWYWPLPIFLERWLLVITSYYYGYLTYVYYILWLPTTKAYILVIQISLNSIPLFQAKLGKTQYSSNKSMYRTCLLRPTGNGIIVVLIERWSVYRGCHQCFLWTFQAAFYYWVILSSIIPHLQYHLRCHCLYSQELIHIILCI